MEDDELLADQIRYYDRRAPVYEQLYFLQGPYAGGDPEIERGWRRETAALEAFVEGFPPLGSCLELACGNGLWTRFLVHRTSNVLALDASQRMLDRNREWVGDPRVRYVRADVFEWDHAERFDLVFAGFFLSHVPPTRWQPFLQKVHGWLAPGGTFAFVDDVWGPGRPRSGERPEGGPDHAHIRRLDGSSFTIVKRFFRPEELAQALAQEGFRPDVRSTGEYFLFGSAGAGRAGGDEASG